VILVNGSMEPRGARPWRAVALVLALAALSVLPAVAASGKFTVEPLAEKKLAQLPAGPLYWRIENFSTMAEARTTEGPDSLAAAAAGRVWLFTLGAKGARTVGAEEVAEIGPIPRIAAPEYLLRVNIASGSPGAKTPVHTHPGTETFYVLRGRLGQETPEGTKQVEAGAGMPGHAADTPMEVFSASAGELDALVMFVVDATRPFSSPAQFK
jgi:hypothetical protein